MNVITRQLPPLRLQSEVDCNFCVRDMRRSRSRSTHEQTDQRKRGIAAKKVGRHGAAAEALQLGTRPPTRAGRNSSLFTMTDLLSGGAQ